MGFILLEVGSLDLKEVESHCFLSASYVTKTDSEHVEADDKGVDEDVAEMMVKKMKKIKTKKKMIPDVDAEEKDG